LKHGSKRKGLVAIAYWRKAEKNWRLESSVVTVMKSSSFKDPAVKAKFDVYPPPLKSALLDLRRLIYAAAEETDAIGELTETLKWAQPAYLPKRPNIGTTVRIDALKGSSNRFAMFFHCQTTLVPTFRELYGDLFAFEGNRAVLFTVGKKPPEKALKHCIAMALTYHIRGER
jgi:hypothetical protein